MALSEFEIIVGGLTSIPVVAGIFFLIEKTYGSRNYLRKPVKASPAPKATAPKPAASKQQDGSSVKPPSTKTPSAKLKTSIPTKKSAAPTPPESAPDQGESIQSKVSTPAEKNSESSTDTSS